MPYTLKQLSDIECIRELARRYCRGVDRLDETLLKSAYWPDATDEHGTFSGNAHEFAEHCMVAHQVWRWTQHCIFNHSIELAEDGLNATGELYNVSYLYRRDEDVLDTWHGRYLDHYQKRGGIWRILERVCVHEGSSSADALPMPISADAFRQGDFDRGLTGRPVGP